MKLLKLIGCFSFAYMVSACVENVEKPSNKPESDNDVLQFSLEEISGEKKYITFFDQDLGVDSVVAVTDSFTFSNNGEFSGAYDGNWRIEDGVLYLDETGPSVEEGFKKFSGYDGLVQICITDNGGIPSDCRNEEVIYWSNTEVEAIEAETLAFSSDEMIENTFYFAAEPNETDCNNSDWFLETMSFNSGNYSYSRCNGTETGTYFVDENGVIVINYNINEIEYLRVVDSSPAAGDILICWEQSLIETGEGCKAFPLFLNQTDAQTYIDAQ